MDGLPLVIGRLQHDFRMWGDVDGPRSLHLFGHYALIFEASCESFRLGEPRAPNLVDEAANLGATAWWALDKHSASPISEEAIAEQYSQQSTSTRGGWQTHAKPLVEWRRRLRRHSAAVLWAPARGMFKPEEIVVPNLVSVIGLAEHGAQWINQKGLQGDEFE